MNRISRVFRILAAAPGTWLAIVVVAGLEWIFFQWFAPPVLFQLAGGGTGIFLLLLWLVLFLRSEDFSRAYYGMPDATETGDLENLLKSCHPTFQTPARACLALALAIQKEFKGQTFLDEVDGMLQSLALLARNHIELFDRSQRFGTPEQKRTMNDLLRDQARSVENSLVALQRFSGNLTLFDLHAKDQQDIDGELKAINIGLQDAIQEIQP